MSLAVLRSRALAGMEAPAVSVEVHLANGLPGLTIVGTNTPTAYISETQYHTGAKSAYTSAFCWRSVLPQWASRSSSVAIFWSGMPLIDSSNRAFSIAKSPFTLLGYQILYKSTML